ncbi:MAG: 3-methyl-2-oxobutanoate hydroxymethyltransferase [Gracilibacter sp. BRH_c7a]|nr:MAG: 3-methyl-2-oxobutanoate hydroxymethyltransferase [Gracilibacter sp. BRH_c7a]
MAKKTIHDFQRMVSKNEKISMLTAYDYPSASILEKAEIDIILVGDSLGMVVLGYDSTVPVTMEEMLHHTKAVRRGAPNTFIVADLPFLSYATSEDALKNAGRLIKEGDADAVKLEGGEGFAETVRVLTRAGISVVGHIGLTPQTISQLGGYKVQGKDFESASQLNQDALSLEKAGIIMLVLEAIPKQLAEIITTELSVPTIGIGAGDKCDGQVLVFHDLMGLFDKFVPKFVKQYESLGSLAVEAVKKYSKEVKESAFPTDKHSFSLSEEITNRLYDKKRK